MFQKVIVHSKKSFILTIVLALFVVLCSSAYATNGYFAHGYGSKYMALAGAGVALSLESLAAATNPAAMVFLGNRIDLSVSLFSPDREYTVTGGPSGFPGTFGLLPGTIESGTKSFIVPSFGGNWMITDNISVGLSVYGNGGMNTDYDTSPFYGASPTGVNLVQIFVAPTVAVKLAPQHGIGVTPIFCYQYFKADGLEAFGNFSSDATKLTGKGNNSSTGYGVRVGYLGQWSRYFSVGASYQTKINMEDFDDYAGLFAEQGSFDIPASWTVGAAVSPIDRVTLVFDVQQILYSDVKSISNPFDPADFFRGILLGSDEGAGFGWEDTTIFKGGIQWMSGAGWTWRAGYSYGEQPIPETEVLFNILAPATIEQHLTFGFSKTIGRTQEFSATVMYCPPKSVTGSNPMEVPGLQTIELNMKQWQFSLSFSF